MADFRKTETSILTLLAAFSVLWGTPAVAEIDVSESCEVMSLYGELQKDGKKFRSNGVGTAFEASLEGKTQNLVLTPAHVIAYADKVVLVCKGHETEAEILKFDLEADIAVLKVEKAEWQKRLNPSFSLTRAMRRIAPKENGQDPLSSDDLFYQFRRGTFSGEGLTRTAGMWVPTKDDVWPAMPDYVEAANSYWPVHGTMIDLIGVGIVPGMSGAPVYGEGQQGELSPYLGMTIKTEINGSRSLAIPGHSIEKWLRANLENGAQRVQQANLGYNIEYFFVKDGEKINRHRSLKIRSSSGHVEEFFEECPSGAWFLNSSWLDSAGGSWGDGGGGYVHDSYSGKGEYAIALLGMFRNLKGCSSEGVKTKSGDRFVGAKINRTLYSVKQLEDLIALRSKLSEGSSFGQTLVSAESIDFADLCKGDKSVFPAGIGMGYGRDVGPQDFSKGFSNSTYRSFRSRGLQKKVFSCGRNGTFEANLNFRKDPWIFREFDGENRGSNTSGADIMISGTLKITKTHIEADLKMHGQKIAFKAPRQATWTHSFRVQGGQLLIDFGTSERIFHVTFAPDKATEQTPWTISHSWLSKDAVR